MSRGMEMTALLLRLLFVFVSLAASPALAGQLKVLVTDPSAAPIPSVAVSLTALSGAGAPRSAATDARGEVRFDALPIGAYRILAQKPGYTPNSVDVQIDSRPVSQRIVLYSNAAPITTGALIEDEFLDNIPVGRTFEAEITSAPARGRAGMGGGSRNENTYLLDGSNITPSAAPPAPSPAPVAPPAPTPPPDALTSEPAKPGPSRMVHYSGWAALSVPNPRETLDEVGKIAEASGGKTEQMNDRSVTIRVPVARFKEIWQRVLALGEPLNQSVRADDVTDQHTAIDLRLRVLKGTRERLIALLAKAQDEQEKLRLLEEITRVTEEIDTLESQLRTLSELASMSRITVEAVPREAFSAAGSRPDAVGFEWISSLSPFQRGIWRDDHRVELPIPDKMVALTQRGPLVAESSGGTSLWTMRIDNDPIGSSDFWISAVEERLSKEFDGPSRRAIGPWKCLSLSEPGTEEPYLWEICVQTDGKRLLVAQIYLPDADEKQRYGEAIDRALGAAGGET